MKNIKYKNKGKKKKKKKKRKHEPNKGGIRRENMRDRKRGFPLITIQRGWNEGCPSPFPDS